MERPNKMQRLQSSLTTDYTNISINNNNNNNNSNNNAHNEITELPSILVVNHHNDPHEAYSYIFNDAKKDTLHDVRQRLIDNYRSIIPNKFEFVFQYYNENEDCSVQIVRSHEHTHLAKKFIGKKLTPILPQSNINDYLTVDNGVFVQIFSEHFDVAELGKLRPVSKTWRNFCTSAINLKCILKNGVKMKFSSR